MIGAKCADYIAKCNTLVLSCAEKGGALVSTVNKNSELMSVRLPLWVAKDLREVAADTGSTVSALIVEACEEFLVTYEMLKKGGGEE